LLYTGNKILDNLDLCNSNLRGLLAVGAGPPPFDLVVHTLDHFNLKPNVHFTSGTVTSLVVRDHGILRVCQIHLLSPRNRRYRDLLQQCRRQRLLARHWHQQHSIRTIQFKSRFRQQNVHKIGESLGRFCGLGVAECVGGGGYSGSRVEG